MNLEGRRQYFSIPNLISYFRILLVPFIVVQYVQHDNLTVVLILFIISGLSDAVDGYIARRFNQVTQVGKVIDPVADKLTQFAVLIMVTVNYPVVWFVFAMYLIKDFIIAFSTYYLYKKKNLLPDGAKWYGKVCTVLFYALVFLLLVVRNVPTDIVLYIAVPYTVYVGITAALYTRHFYRRYKYGDPEVTE